VLPIGVVLFDREAPGSPPHRDEALSAKCVPMIVLLKDAFVHQGLALAGQAWRKQAVKLDDKAIMKMFWRTGNPLQERSFGCLAHWLDRRAFLPARSPSLPM